MLDAKSEHTDKTNCQHSLLNKRGTEISEDSPAMPILQENNSTTMVIENRLQVSRQEDLNAKDCRSQEQSNKLQKFNFDDLEEMSGFLDSDLDGNNWSNFD